MLYQKVKVLCGCSVGSVLLLASLLAPAARAQSNTVHQLGVLNSGDEQFSTGSYYDSYKIEGSAGQRISISLDSSDFDTLVGLFDSDGNLIATNNDATETNQNSFISATLPRNDTYSVVATSFSSEGIGDYRMSLRNFSPPTVARTGSSNSSSNGFSALAENPLAQLFILGIVNSMFSFGGSSSTTPDYERYSDYSTTPSSQPSRGMSYPQGSGIHGNGPQHGTRNAW